MQVHGVELPDPLPGLMDDSTARVGKAAMVSAIKAAIRRGISVRTVEGDLRKAIAAAAQRAGAKDPSPTEVFRLCTAYLENSRDRTDEVRAPRYGSSGGSMAGSGYEPYRPNPEDLPPELR